MNVQFKPLNKNDIKGLNEPMKNAFDDDSRRFCGRERGGPPGYDDGSFLIKWAIKNKHSISYKILVDGKSVGAFIIWWNETGESILGNIFIDPVFQNKGIGTKTWHFIEENFPAKNWKLETPIWATRNHYFYEKLCGFKKTGMNGDQVIYKKELGRLD